MTPTRAMYIGVIADTHGLFDHSILPHFKHVDHIIHAGDIGTRSVIAQLETIAPVTAVSGNVDDYEQSGFPREAVIELGGFRIAVRHILYEGGKLTREGQVFLNRVQPDICIFGHTHRPTKEWFGNTLLFNPGSAGPKRFKLSRQVGLLTIQEDNVRARHIVLADEKRPVVVSTVE